MRRSFAAAIFGLLALPLAARAQLMLPGAAPPAATPSVAPPAGASLTPGRSGPFGAGKSDHGEKGDDAEKAAKRAGGGGSTATIHPPGEDTIVGRQLQQNGKQGVIQIEKPAGGLEITRIFLPGYQISRPAEACRVDISGARISVKPAAERYQGLLTYDAALEACPFSFDVLDGAIRVRAAVCEFKAADCKVDPAGVWGPTGASIGPEQAKNIEHVRARSEADARAMFRELLRDNRKDRNKVKDIARDQAGFSSIREETCRDYANEDKHGFCASRITAAHAVALSAQLHGTVTATTGGSSETRATSPKPKPKARPAPKLPPLATTTPAPAPTAPLPLR